MHIQSHAVEAYLASHARPLDLALYQSRFAGGSARAVLDNLAVYQNEDGGFGHGIEPDFTMPQSSALGTTIAFHYVSAIDATGAEPLLQRALAYLRDTYDPALTGWTIVRREVDDYPHAPWWGYEAAISGFGWGNPCAEILGYLLAYGDRSADHALIAAVTKRAMQRLEELSLMSDPDFHEIACYVRLHDCGDELLRSQLFAPLASLIGTVVKTDPQEWASYCATPLTFVNNPGSSFTHLFDAATLNANLDHVASSLIDGDHWEPVWDWGGDYPEDWALAKQAWSGKITVDNMLVLGAFEWGLA